MSSSTEWQMGYLSWPITLKWLAFCHTAKTLRTHSACSWLGIRSREQGNQTWTQLGRPGPSPSSGVHTEHCSTCRRWSLARLQNASEAAWNRHEDVHTWDMALETRKINKWPTLFKKWCSRLPYLIGAGVMQKAAKTLLTIQCLLYHDLRVRTVPSFPLCFHTDGTPESVKSSPPPLPGSHFAFLSNLVEDWLAPWHERWLVAAVWITGSTPCRFPLTSSSPSPG